MKKIKFAKKSRKLFSVILAGAMLTTSVIPESFVWASEEVQEFGDSESLGFGSTSDPMPGAGGYGEDQVLSDFQDMPDIQNGNDTVDMESGFTDESDSFGSNGRDSSVESGFQSLASVGELQERINALPTVEEFQNLADGTTVEGSTLNQAQTDVYTEAQDIAEKLDMLSEEEQGLVDVSRLEALFGYFNGMTEELETTTNVIEPVTSGSVSITSGGTYTLNGGAYTTPDSAIIIDTEQPVTLNIVGDITAATAPKGSDRTPFINIKTNCKKLKIINNENFKVELINGSVSLLKDSSNDGVDQINFTGGIYKASTDKASMIYFQGTIEFQNAVFKATGSTRDSGHIVTNIGSSTRTVKIHSGTLIDAGNSRISNHQDACINAEIVQMDGGTITGNIQNGHISGIKANNVQFTGGVIENCEPAILYMDSKQKEGIKIGGNATFKNNNSDISLLEGQVFTIQDDFKGNATVFFGQTGITLGKITTSGISKSMLGRITSKNGGYSVNYAEDENGGYLFLSNHKHTWSYSSNDNKIIAKCTDTNCKNELELSLTAANSDYLGEAYTGAEVENNISYVTGRKADIVYYLEDGKTTTNAKNSGAASNGAAPVYVGNYVIKVSVEDQTLSSAFKIEKAPVTLNNFSLEGWEYGQAEHTPQVTVKSDEKDITQLYNKSQITYKYYTDKTCTKETTKANGAGTDGAVPKNAGTYYVKAAVAENRNYAGAEAEASFTIAPLPADLTWSKTDLIYTGSEQSVSATVANALEGDSFAIAYEGNTQTEAGDSYTATVTDLGNDNYTLTGATGVSQNWSISYLQTSNKAEPSGKKVNEDWYVSAVKLIPDSGYQISADKTVWKDSLGDYVTQGSNTVEYYLKETATGAVTDKKTATFKIDTEVPTGKIEIGTNTFSGSPNPVAYDYWFRNNAAVDITGADSTSGIASIEYQKVKADESYDVNGTWVTWDAANKLSLTESGKYVIYARITDNAGNQTIINSDGVVVFKDSVVVDSSIDYTRTTKTSVDAKVTLNGNTVASVKNGENTLTAGKDYTVSADKITFSGEYLDTLAVGTYTLTVAYHPQGETQYTGGDKPAESQIALKVKHQTVNITYQTANVKITSVLDKEYDGQPADLVYTTNSTASVKVEYNVNGIWQTKAPTYAGTYEVKVSVPGNSYFTAASTTKTYTIKPRGVEISGITANKKVYDGTKNAELDYSKVVFARLIEGDALTVSAEGTFADSNAAKGKTVTITNLVLGGRSASNYVLTADGQQTGTIADINPKRITVTADNLKKIVGGADPVLTYTASGLVGEDTLSGIVVKRKAGEKVGTYAIKVSQKTGSNPNYRITFKKGIFTIQQADQSKLKGKDIYRLKLPVFFAKGKANKNSITLSWKKYAGATGYDVYWSYCDGRINYKKVGTVKSGKFSMSHKKLKKDHEYKYFVAAYKMVEGRKIYIARSNDVHVALKQASTTNAASIKVNRTEIALSVGKTFQLKCSLKAEDSRKDLVSHTSPFRYYTTNSKVATVNKDGVIKAKGKGVCTIYILANNGVYKKVTVTVK